MSIIGQILVNILQSLTELNKIKSNNFRDPTASKCVSCPASYQRFTSGSTTGCYFLSTYGAAWSTCKTYCEGFNGTLVNFETLSELQMVANQIGNTRYWVFIKIFTKN